MRYEKGNKYGAKKILEAPLDKDPISFKGFLGQREALRRVPKWQDKFREYTEQLISAVGRDQ
jgi:hypothetical protein